jgi:hypothetical protein
MDETSVGAAFASAKLRICIDAALKAAGTAFRPCKNSTWLAEVRKNTMEAVEASKQLSTIDIHRSLSSIELKNDIRVDLDPEKL